MQTNTLTINAVKEQTIGDANNRHFELRLWLVLLVVTNLGLLLGNVPAGNLIFRSDAISAGEWWRLLCWPFVHVSRYHLLLDGSAFLLIYSGLRESKRRNRLCYVLSVSIGSLLLPLAISPEIGTLGLCGLSGPAHGLLAITALEMLHESNNRQVGLLLLGGLLLKTGWELASGVVFLQQWHIGEIGQPIVATHAGGFSAGIIHYQLKNFRWKTLFRKAG